MHGIHRSMFSLPLFLYDKRSCKIFYDQVSQMLLYRNRGYISKDCWEFYYSQRKKLQNMYTIKKIQHKKKDIIFRLIFVEKYI